MNVTETRADGLQRELKVTIPAAALDEKLTAYLDDMRTKVRLKGFRPGKVPMAHLRKVYGKSAMAEVVNEVLTKSVTDAVEGRGETPAMQPDIKLDEGSVGDVMEGKSDLSFDITYEILPPIEVSGLEAITIERPVVTIEDEAVETEVTEIAKRNRDYEAVERAAQDEDRLTINFAGRVDGELFEGGTAEDVALVLGSGQFIPGFEDQMVGASTGEDRTVTVTFPDDYPTEALAGKEAVFDVSVKEVGAPKESVIDDALAEKLGLESIDKLREAIRTQMEQAYSSASRQKAKRALLDALDEKFQFDLPQKLVESEFETIWRQVVAEMERNEKEFAAEGEESEAEMRAEYGRIAERRVRLGLLLSDIGTNAKVEVTDEEVQRALQERIRQFPGQEREVFEYYKNTPQAVAALRAPIFEDKVVDYILELVTVTDKPVTKEELLKPDDDDLPGEGGSDDDTPATEANQ